jgi:hypothetical protein
VGYFGTPRKLFGLENKKGVTMPIKRKINWGIIAGVIQIAMGLIEIAVIIAQCITSKDENENE